MLIQRMPPFQEPPHIPLRTSERFLVGGLYLLMTAFALAVLTLARWGASGQLGERPVTEVTVHIVRERTGYRGKPKAPFIYHEVQTFYDTQRYSGPVRCDVTLPFYGDVFPRVGDKISLRIQAIGCGGELLASASEPEQVELLPPLLASALFLFASVLCFLTGFSYTRQGR